MAIYQRGKSWYYDFVHKGQRYTGCFGQVSRTVAKEELARKKTEVIEQKLNPAKARKSPRFDTFADEYLEWCKSNKKPSSVLRTKSVLKHLKAFFGAKKLNDLTPWYLEQYKKTRKEERKSAVTINLELGMLKTLLRKAQQWGKLSEYPGKEVKALKVTQPTTRFLSDEEEGAILAVCPPALRRVVEAGLLTGFRRQGLATLRPEDVDSVRGTVSVAACYSKNGDSRTLPVSPRLSAILQEARTTRGNAPMVFVNEEGKPWRLNALGMVFSKVCEQAGVGRLGIHVLRHTFASRLVMAGVDLRTVQELMGHKDIAMTTRYAHLSSNHKRAAMEALESRFSVKSPANFHNTPLSPLPENHAKVAVIG